MLYNYDALMQMEKQFRAMFINSLGGFKSLQLLGTIDEAGNTNLSVFSSIFHLGANPPLVGMVARPPGPQHDTLKNIKTTGFYTLNNVLAGFYKEAHQASARYPSGESEFKYCGFTEAYVDGFKAPYILESSLSIGLELKEVLPVTLNETSIIIGEIKWVKVDEEFVSEDGFVDLEKAGSVTVSGLDSYHITKKLARLSYAKPDKFPEELHVKL
jgi:flavin reductase (DIM6/NTAB) family NADH-FMN oxidoreductase RutF